MKTVGGKEVPVKLVGNSTFGRYPKISSEKTYNMFVSDEWLVDFFGWKKVGIWPSDGTTGRGQFVSTRSNTIIAVIGSAVISIDSNSVATFVGDLKSSQGLVSFAENLNAQICICDSIDAYIYNTSTRSLTEQNITSFVPNYVDYHNTYFLFGNGDYTSNGSKWYVYQYESSTTISYVSSPALQTKPDFAIAVKRIPSGGNNVLVFGKTVTEIQTNVGAASVNIYQPVSSYSIDYGVASIDTIASNDRMVVWLGMNEFDSPNLMMYTPQGAKSLTQVDSKGNDRTDGINYVIENVKNPYIAFGYMLRRDGHIFYVITFPDEQDNFTLAYDFKTDGYIFLTDQHMDFFPPVSVSYFNGASYFTSYINNGIYQISTDFVTYDENIIGNNPELNYFVPRSRICDNVRFANSDQYIANLVRMTIDNGDDPAFGQLTVSEGITFITNEAGEILTSEQDIPLVTQGSTESIPYIPRIDLSYSNDGGRTWSIYVSQDLHFDAYRQSIVQWENLGAGNDIVLKFFFWMKSHVVATQCIMEVKQ